MSKILVTGGAGFIGSHLVDVLIEQDHEIIIIDDLSTGKKENINPKATFKEVNIVNFKDIKSHFKEVDYVFHLAAMPRVQESIESPLATHEINITGSLNVLQAAKEAGVKRVIYSSSSAVYGDVEIPTTEDMPKNPLSPYGLQKYMGEYYARLFSSLYGLETVCFRYFNVYGDRMSAEGAYINVISVFQKQKNEGLPLTITGDGEQTRDFVNVKDVVQANILAMTATKVGKGEAINIGAGQGHAVNEIARRIGGEVKHIAPRVEPKHTLADISRAKELLNWEPQVELTL